MTDVDPHVDGVLAAVDDHAAALSEIDDDHLAAATEAHNQLPANQVGGWRAPTDPDPDDD